MRDHLPSLSVVVPAYNERKVIRRVVTSVLSNGYPGPLEIRVADNASTDGTADVVRDLMVKYPNLHLVPAPYKGVSKARNAGAAHATGEWLAFLDADVQVTSIFLREALTEILNRKLHVAGCYATADTGKLAHQMFLGTGNQVMKLLQRTPRPMALGAGIFIRTELHDKIGGYDESMYFGEDADYVTRAATIANFGMLRNAQIVFDMRRLYQEGALRLAAKSLEGFFRHVVIGSTKGVRFAYSDYRS